MFNQAKSSVLLRTLVTSLTASVMLLVCFGANANSDTAMDLLQEMSIAADSLDYSGEFVFVKDGDISSMKVNHIRAFKSKSSQQKLMALDGSMREIILQNDEVACVLPDEGMGLREKRQSRQPFKFNISDSVEDIERHYSLRLTGHSRVAGRDCKQMDIIAKDQYRYGYRLCIDAQNSLLLKSELTRQDGRLLESYMFVNIVFGNADLSQLASETPPAELNWMDDKDSNTLDVMQNQDGVQKWRVSENKSGFMLKQYIERLSPVMQADITHLVLGDGLAKISVFISQSESSANKEKKALSMGSLNSYTLEHAPYMITAIGEVPPETVAIIAQSTELTP